MAMGNKENKYVYITFDLGMLSRHKYYTGVIFSAYTYDVGEPVAKGGRYDKLIGQFGKQKRFYNIIVCAQIKAAHFIPGLTSCS